MDKKNKRKYDLVCFDLDGTLIEEDNGVILWERMSEKVYGSKKVSEERYKLHLKGELSIDEWVDLDLAQWKKMRVTKAMVKREARHSRLNHGIRETLKELKKQGIKLGIISGSVDILLDTVFPDHPFDDVFINRLKFDRKGYLSSWKKCEYGNGRKNVALKMIAKRENIPLSRTVFVGDHLNDIPAARIAGLSIAFNSHVKKFQDKCDVVIKKKDMREILKRVL